MATRLWAAFFVFPLPPLSFYSISHQFWTSFILTFLFYFSVLSIFWLDSQSILFLFLHSSLCCVDPPPSQLNLDSLSQGRLGSLFRSKKPSGFFSPNMGISSSLVRPTFTSTSSSITLYPFVSYLQISLRHIFPTCVSYPLPVTHPHIHTCRLHRRKFAGAWQNPGPGKYLQILDPHPDINWPKFLNPIAMVWLHQTHVRGLKQSLPYIAKKKKTARQFILTWFPK